MSVLRDSYQIVPGSGLALAIVTAELTEVVQKGKTYIITVNTDTFIRFSGSAVVATDGNFDLFMPAGSSAILTATHATFRAIRSTADGVGSISEAAVV